MGQDSRNDGKKVNKVEMEIDSLEVAVGALRLAHSWRGGKGGIT